eukprot:IDg1127t1
MSSEYLLKNQGCTESQTLLRLASVRALAILLYSCPMKRPVTAVTFIDVEVQEDLTFRVWIVQCSVS